MAETRYFEQANNSGYEGGDVTFFRASVGRFCTRNRHVGNSERAPGIELSGMRDHACCLGPDRTARGKRERLCGSGESCPSGEIAICRSAIESAGRRVDREHDL